jgi:hypothetical protein
LVVLGSTETTEDFGFLLSCSNADKSAEMTVYDEIEDAKVDQPVAIELTRMAPKPRSKARPLPTKCVALSSPKPFPVKPVIAVLDGKGPVNVVTGKTVTVLAEEGRVPEPNLPNNSSSTNKSAA